MTSREGQVVRAHGHVYYVLVGEEVLECRPRGRFRLQGRSVVAGDKVKVRVLSATEGYIEEVLPRRNVLTRPPVANVDQAVIVFTPREPNLDWRTLDRFLVLAEAAGLRCILVLNKIDLVTPAEAEAALAPYRPARYALVPISAQLGVGVDNLRPLLAGRVSVLAGQSGVGKSRTLNALQPDLNLRTGDVSRKVARGRHTTRHVELLRLSSMPGALVADTPGFSHIDFAEVDKDELRFCFPELRAREGQCRFSGCVHWHEPDCAVRAAVADGAIAPSRYENYLVFLQEISARPPRYH